MLSASTMLDVLSAAQSHGGAPELWASDVATIVMQRAPGTVALETEVYAAADRSLTFLGGPTGRSREITRTGHEGLSADDCRRIYETSTFVRSTWSFFDGAPPAELREAMARDGIGDIVGVAQPRLDSRQALCFTVLLEASARGDASLCRRWATLARHLGALAEARSWLDGGGADAALAGKLGRAGGVSSLDEVVEAAVRELDRRRARSLRRGEEDDAREVLDLWSFMLDRGFVVLDHAREGARGRLVAVRLRDAEWDALRRLTRNERRVVDEAARGLSNKEIAFDLGIDEATVATRLRTAQRRLGVRSRVELVHLARAMGRTR